MFENNKDLFTAFKELHNKYAEDETTWKSEFNRQGTQVLEVVRMHERRLCMEMNRGQYSKYSSKPADKFWDEVREHYPKIDFIGLE